MKAGDNTQYQKIMKWTSAIMAIAYVALGASLLLALGDLEHVPGTTRILLGLMMASYGLFRAYRFWSNHYSKKEEDEA